jgi:heme exporter protein B
MIGAPLLLFAPVLCVLLQGSVGDLGALWLSLFLAIPTLSLIGSLGAALTVGLGEGGVLLAIIVLPLMIPVVIFGVSVLTAAQMGMPFYSELLLLGACLLLAVTLVPVAMATAIRASFL